MPLNECLKKDIAYLLEVLDSKYVVGEARDKIQKCLNEKVKALCGEG
jgi:hypothetical protein